MWAKEIEDIEKEIIKGLECVKDNSKCDIIKNHIAKWLMTIFKEEMLLQCLEMELLQQDGNKWNNEHSVMFRQFMDNQVYDYEYILNILKKI